MGFGQGFIEKAMEKHDFPIYFPAASAAAAAEAAAATPFDACLGSFAEVIYNSLSIRTLACQWVAGSQATS